jgi:tRNA threonylcarbamoyladenosine biosynthesis protein TsaB
MKSMPPEFLSRPLLAIDTSSAQGGIALYDGQLLSLRSWPAERSHTTTVLAEIHRLLSASELEIRDLAAIAVAVGPGAFTGLRVGFGVAKGFHLATGVPLIGVSTLEATALPFALCGEPVVATVAAGRGRLVWARYAPDEEGLAETHPPRNGTITELVDELRVAGPVFVVGEIEDDQARLIGSVDGVAIPPRALRARQPSALAELGWRRWQSGSVDNAIALEPIYLSR